METGRRDFVVWTLGAAASLILGVGNAAFAEESRLAETKGGEGAAAGGKRNFDFALETSRGIPGSVRVGPKTAFTTERGYGWLTVEGLDARERTGADPQVRRAFSFARNPHTFRIAGLPAGRYLLTFLSGDPSFGDHQTHVTVPGRADDLPVLHPVAGAFVTLTVVADVAEGRPLDLVFDAPAGSWVLNTLTLEPTTLALDTKPNVTTEHGATHGATGEIVSAWGPIFSWPDPTTDLIKGHRERMKSAPKIDPTNLTRADYLKIITGEVDFWKTKQNADGAIIDPYRHVEFQYSTPCFAHAASALIAWAGRDDLIEPAAKALGWAAWTLSERKAASGHEDFFAPVLAHAIRLLKPHVPAERSAKWEADIRRFDPFATYRAAVGHGGNWNVVAASGEALFQQMGLREKGNRFVEASFAGQGAVFRTPYGLYLEGPMAYDHFPRLWAGDLIGHGYDGPYAKELTEVLRRASITSLFMQSPWGELPAGGRSAQHQWNEAEQCVTYEVFAERAHAAGDDELAAIFKRAAHLALRSMFRWVRPSGEMQIVKNWVDPEKAHAFEGYSAHSQYNLLPMAMLSIAYEHAGSTESIAELPAPAEVGGFTLQIEPLHKFFGNVQGTYVEIDTAGDHHYDATGTLRVHMPGVCPQIGPSDSVLAHPSYRVEKGSPVPPTTGIGVAWQSADGAWHVFGELTKADITDCKVESHAEPGKVSFTLRYEGKLNGVSVVEERYELTPGRVEITTRLPGYAGPVRRIVPVLADDGKTKTDVVAGGRTVSVSLKGSVGGKTQTYTALDATPVTVGADQYPNHNGWARLMTAEYPSGVGDRGVTLVIAPQG